MSAQKRSLFSIGLILLFAAGLAGAHEAPHLRPGPQGAIDPKQSYQFLVLSGAGGHFHTLLLTPGLRTLFAGTHLGLFRSEDHGLTWRLAASRFSREEVHGLAMNPRKGIIYAVTHGQGLLQSHDGGRHWRECAGRLPGRDLHALALDPRPPHLLYVWVVGYGLFRGSGCAGRWSQMTGASTLTGVEGLAVHPQESERLYAGTDKGIWVSNDGGKHWQFPEGGLSHRTAGVAVPPWRPDILFAATPEGAFTGKTDGTGWKPLPPHPSWWGPLITFAFLRNRPNRLFVVSHEGVVAVQDFPGGEWAPLAQPEQKAP